MSWKVSLACLVAVAGVSAGCATASDPYSPSAYPASVSSPVRTDAPQIDNADAAGPASVPGMHTGAPEPSAASPVIVVPPAQPR